MNEETRIKLRETRRLMMADLESSMLKGKSPEDSIFYYHSSEDRIVLSHALFWVMTKSLKGKVAKEKNLDKVKCRKIEQMLPQLNKMVEEEIKGGAANVLYVFSEYLPNRWRFLLSTKHHRLDPDPLDANLITLK